MTQEIFTGVCQLILIAPFAMYMLNIMKKQIDMNAFRNRPTTNLCGVYRER